MTNIVEFPEKRQLAEEAAAWLIRLDADTPVSSEELQALGEWLHRSPAHREELDKLASLWGRMNVLTELAVPLGISNRPAHAAGHDIGRRWAWRPIGLSIAAAAIVLALTLVLLLPKPAVDSKLAGNGLYATAVGQQKTATLADGSQIILNTNSQIRVDYGKEHRDLHLLQGEALFTVAKNSRRPFRVYAGNRRIEALGTAFSVYLDGADVSVTVTEGRVSLASLGTLEAGHVATIPGSLPSGESVDETIKPITPEELAQRLAWREGALMFSGETLEEAVKQLSRYTTLSIEIPDASVRSMRIGGRLPAGETDAMLAALQTNFHLRVTRVGDNRVVLAAAE